MAKPLPTTDTTAKSGTRILEMLRASLEEREKAMEHEPPDTTNRAEPETWTDSAGTEDSQLIPPPLADETKEGAAEPKAPAASIQLQLDALRAENSRLRTTIRELEATTEELEQRSLPSGGSGGGHDEELLALNEELEHERRQLKEDETAVVQQMRDLEIQMSRERAEVARQRNELTRLHNEIRHELELAARDAGLRERLAPLQRRHNEISARGSGKARQADTQQDAQPAEVPQSNGIFRRLFGK